LSYGGQFILLSCNLNFLLSCITLAIFQINLGLIAIKTVSKLLALAVFPIPGNLSLIGNCFIKNQITSQIIYLNFYFVYALASSLALCPSATICSAKPFGAAKITIPGALEHKNGTIRKDGRRGNQVHSCGLFFYKIVIFSFTQTLGDYCPGRTNHFPVIARSPTNLFSITSGISA